MKRKSGVLLHVSALPNKYGIGTFGTESYDFIDFLSESKQKIWEILPLNQTGFGDSPYSSCCSYSFNPYFISLDALVGYGLLKRSELKSYEDNCAYIDYGRLYNTRYDLLRKAFDRYNKNDEDFIKFVKNGEYKDYALYMALRLKNDNKAFYDWPSEYKFRDKKALKRFEKENMNEILFWQFVQFEAINQWLSVKTYANSKGVKIIGDLPLYVAYDSVDVWVNPNNFKLDENLTPKKVAGVPPDYFSKTGQLWGNPVYDYDEMRKDGFSWWTKRFVKTLKYYNFVRIDHFRGFDRFYEIDYGMDTAMIGQWVKVPSDELFGAICKRVSKSRIIAEDLGIIDEGVVALLNKLDLPGMRILSFAFNSEPTNPYLPENVENKSVCYTGTHDNDTLMGLLDHFDEWDYNNFVKGVERSLQKFSITKKLDTKNDVARAVCELGFASNSDLFIIPMQDVALLNSDYRMNTPGREIANWTLKMPKSSFGKKYSNYLKSMTKKYNR